MIKLILIGILIIFSICFYAYFRYATKIPFLRFVRLSPAARVIITRWAKLPEDTRQSFSDIVTVLESLDKSLTRKKVARHYIRIDLDGGHFSWRTYVCTHRDCEYKDYYEIFNEITTLENNLKAQAKVLYSQKNPIDRDGLEILKARIRQENEITMSVTNQLI